MRKLVRREVLHVAAMLSLLALGTRCGEMGEELDHAHLDLKTGLLVSERQALNICVEVDPALKAQSKQLLSALEEDLAEVERTHPHWANARFGSARPQVHLGCPVNAMPSSRLKGKGELVGPGATKVPSAFRTHVYLLGDAKAEEVLGEMPAVRAHAETLRVSDHEFVEVSTALVLRASTLGTSSSREEWLPQAIGLKSLKATPEPVSGDFVPKTYPADGLTK